MSAVSSVPTVADGPHTSDAPARPGPELPFHRPAFVGFFGVAFGIIAFVGAALVAWEVVPGHPAYGALYAAGLLSPFLGRLPMPGSRPARSAPSSRSTGRSGWVPAAG